MVVSTRIHSHGRGPIHSENRRSYTPDDPNSGGGGGSFSGHRRGPGTYHQEDLKTRLHRIQEIRDKYSTARFTGDLPQAYRSAQQMTTLATTALAKGLPESAMLRIVSQRMHGEVLFEMGDLRAAQTAFIDTLSRSEEFARLPKPPTPTQREIALIVKESHAEGLAYRSLIKALYSDHQTAYSGMSNAKRTALGLDPRTRALVRYLSARVHLDHGRGRKALREAEQLSRLCQSGLITEREKVMYCAFGEGVRGIVLSRVSSVKRGLEIVDRAIGALDRIGCRTGRVSWLYERAQIQKMLGDTHPSYSSAMEAYRLAQGGKEGVNVQAERIQLPQVCRLLSELTTTNPVVSGAFASEGNRLLKLQGR